MANICSYSNAELVALKTCADLIVDKYNNLFEMNRGNYYGDTLTHEDLPSILSKLNSAKKQKDIILKEIERRLNDVEE